MGCIFCKLEVGSYLNDRDFSFLILATKELRFTNKALARMFNVSVPTISAWKKGERLPQPVMRSVVARTLKPYFFS